MEVLLNPIRVARFLAGIAALLLVHHALIKLVELTWFADRESRAFSFYARLFTVNREGIVPTFFSVLLLLGCAALLFVIARAVLADSSTRTRPYYQWLALGLIFTFLAIDEGFEIHEGFTSPVLDVAGFDGSWEFYAWILPYGFFFLVVALFSARLVFGLPPRIRNLFIASAAFYLFGAVGMEVIGGRQATSGGIGTASYAVSSTVEELFEMGGVIVFIYALLSHLRSGFSPPVKLAISFS